METGDWIAIAVGGVSVVAAAISIWQARTASISATAAREQAEYAQAQAQAATEANRLTQQQMAREDAREQQVAAEAEAAALREARKVRFEFSGGGGSTIKVRLANYGSRAIHDVELLTVRALVAGPWVGWSVNRNIRGGPLVQTYRNVIEAQQDMVVVVWLLDAQGAQTREPPGSLDAEARFCDADGQWWKTTAARGEPQRVDTPEP
ncbi:hypothetical protein [Streptomyces triculaminicus]|uniref:hypothetical protein n=1 Tax=Streptomyces triculaminicus TaxID=2816232 RepID=UPI0037D4D8C1